MSRFLRTAAAAAAVLLLGIAAYGEQIPPLADVPDGLAGTYRLALLNQRAALSGERDALKARVDQHNQKQAPENSPEEAQLHREGDELAAAMQRHAATSRTFNQTVEAFADIAAGFARGLANAANRAAPLNAPLTNGADHRSAFDYAKVIDQFRVDESARYEPGTATYCNIFVWDVTRAMGAEIPHYVSKGDQAGASTVDELGQFTAPANQLQELNVNRTVAWLAHAGQENGWRRVDARMAQDMANGGHPAVAIWPNPNAEKPGHIATVRPGSLPLSPSGVAIAQAGRLVLDADHLDTGFNDPKLQKAVQYWYHE